MRLFPQGLARLTTRNTFFGRMVQASVLLFSLSLSLLTGISRAGAQQSAPVPLSVAEAVRRTQTANPQARAVLARLRAAQAQQRGARALTPPSLSVAGHAGQDTGGLDEDLILSQTVEIGGKRSARVTAAKANQRSVQAEVLLTAADLALAARSAYAEALRAEAERTLAAEQLATARKFADAAALQFQAGDVARSNVVRSRIEVARAEQALRATETERDNRYATLRSLTGLPDDATLTLTDPLIYAPVTYTLPDLMRTALQNRPDLVSARELLAARNADIRGVKAQRQPDLFVEGRRASLDPSVSGQSIRAGITFPLIDTGRISADTQAAEAARDEQAALVAESERTVRLDVETAFRNVEQAKAAVESFRAGRLDQSKELLEMVQIGYDRGANSYIELLDAQQVYRTEQADYARALVAHQIAAAALERAVGGRLP